MDREKYNEYLCSREWGLKREAVIKRSGGICERCCENEGTAVHHKTYARIYNEPLTDLIHLCDACHDFVHGRGDDDPAEKKYECSHCGKTYTKDFVLGMIMSYTKQIARMEEQHREEVDYLFRAMWAPVMDFGLEKARTPIVHPIWGKLPSDLKKEKA